MTCRDRANSKPRIALRPRRGLTLLETILAVAILGLSLAAIGALVRFGARSAEQARDGTTAQLICDSVMSQVVSGVLAPESVGLSQYYENDEMWLYQINVQPIAQPGAIELPLLEVRVLAQQNPVIAPQPIVYEMVRWIPDPAVVGVAEEEVTEEDGGVSLMGGL